MSSDKKTIRFVDLFAGIGGFHAALKIVAKKQNYNIKNVFVSEIDEQAIETYRNNFNVNEKEIVNIREISDHAADVPDHDFLFAGFPCQTFSSAGKKLGFLDEIRGTLFFDIAKILEAKKPKYILLENVKHLINHDKGRTWEIIINTLKKLGYIIPEKPLILSPYQFGIPQERQRVFIPGVLKSKINFKYSIKNLDINISDLAKKSEIDAFANKDIKTIKDNIWNNFLQSNPDTKYFLNNDKSGKGKYLIRVFKAWNEFLKKVKKPPGRTLPVIWADEFWNNTDTSKLYGWRKKYIEDMQYIYNTNKDFIDNWIKKHDVKEWKRRERKFEWQAGIDINDIKESFIQLRQSGIRCKKPVKFPTLVAMVQIPIIYDKNFKTWRYLTPRETANLQSFPEDYKMYTDIGEDKNDFYAYKQFGNSVNVEVVSRIQKYLLENF